MWTKQFWVDSAERAIRTFAQALIAVLGAGAVNILTTDWTQALSVAAGAALLSLLMSIASSGVGIKGSPSLLPETGAPKASAPEAAASAPADPDLDAADIDIEAWNAERGNPAPDLVDADPNPADVRDTDPKDDAK